MFHSHLWTYAAAGLLIGSVGLLLATAQRRTLHSRALDLTGGEVAGADGARVVPAGHQVGVPRRARRVALTSEHATAVL